MAYFTTVTKVRQDTGFVGNSNVADSFISSMIGFAENMINSAIASVYTLPLPKFYENTIVFSGTGSSTATMTITINSVNYTVAVTSGKTASQCADLFRTAADGSASFVTDGVGNGSTVTINSIGNTAAQVTISSTDPQTVAGITATGGTVTLVTIPFIRDLATLIAGARLLIIEYGAEAQGTDKDGYKRMTLAQQMLDLISSKTEKLIDYAGVELPTSDLKSISFYPTEGSREDADDPTDNFIKVNNQY